MKRTASLAGIVGLALSFGPTAAAGQTDAAAGPIARAVHREAVQLADASQVASPAADPSVRSAERSPSDWSRVRSLKPGAEIVLARSAVPAGRRHVLRTDEAGLTVLNVADAAISAAARGVLVRTASEHPDYFFRAQQRESISLGARNLRLAPEGVFEGDRKVADLGQVIENVPRDAVAEISVLSRHVGRHAKRGAIVGAIAGVGLLGLACAAEGCGGGEAVGIFALAAAGGSAYGALFGSMVGRLAPRTPEVIYRGRPENSVAPVR